MRSLDDIDTLVAFFEGRRGQLHGFRWKDWSDYKSCASSREPEATDQEIGVGDGVSDTFFLRKSYSSGPGSYLRPITKPVAGSVKISVGGIQQIEGVGYSVDLVTGAVTLMNVPGAGVHVTAGFEFDVPVRFDTDRIEASVSTFQAGEVPSVPVVEVRI
jgi:uncharacterized protein (TIGR02217 family)